MPVVLWHRPIADGHRGLQVRARVPRDGLDRYALIAIGLLFFLPVVLSIGRNPDSRLYPRSRAAYVGWGVSLYTLGVAARHARWP